MRISVYDLSYTALPHTFRMASLYGHHTNAHVTGCQQWHYQKLPLLITAFIAGCPIEGFGNDRVMPFCPPKSIILHRKFCFTDDFLLYPQIRNYAPNMIQKRKESASLVKRGHSASNVTIKTYKCPLPHHAT